ncbi:MAG: sulfite exporter TauE/SafE family protein [Chitinophagales bacterium]|nr:sulfite exporter TauE/SafE family protein [Chitinophagales bacterium]
MGRYAAVVVLFLLAEILGTIAGFGSSAFFVGAAQFFLGFKTVLAFTSLQHVFGNFAKIWLFRKDLNWQVALQIGIPALLLTIPGAYLSELTDDKISSLVLGILLVFFSLLLFFNENARLRPTWFNRIGGGAVSGFLAGLVGTGGPVRGLVLASFDLPKNMFVATSALIDAGVDLSRAVIYLRAGYLQEADFGFIPVLIVVAILGTWLGKLVLDRIPQERFRKLVLILLALSGLSLAAQTAF